MMPDGILFKAILFDTPDFDQAWALRDSVLRHPLGLSLDPATRSSESTHQHFGLLLSNGMLLASVSCKEIARGNVRVCQMAVRLDYQGKGLGRMLLLSAENALQKSGIESLELHARVSALGFYTKLGYQSLGDDFLELGIPHRKMTKKVEGARS